MVPESVTQLALQAIEDPDALPVLGDAVIESGWVEPWPLRMRKSYAGKPSRHWALRIAALALFESWPTFRGVVEAWPVVERCRLPSRAGTFTITAVDHEAGTITLSDGSSARTNTDNFEIGDEVQRTSVYANWRRAL